MEAVNIINIIFRIPNAPTVAVLNGNLAVAANIADNPVAGSSRGPFIGSASPATPSTSAAPVLHKRSRKQTLT